MADRQWAYLDDMRRAELPNWTADLASTLDEWLMRMHGLTSSGHYVGAFLNFLYERNLRIDLAVPVESPNNQKEKRA